MSKPFKFEEAMNRLNQISLELEKEDLPLDKSIQLFEEGLDLANKCQLELENYEKKVKDLVSKYQKTDA